MTPSAESVFCTAFCTATCIKESNSELFQYRGDGVDGNELNASVAIIKKINVSKCVIPLSIGFPRLVDTIVRRNFGIAIEAVYTSESFINTLYNSEKFLTLLNPIFYDHTSTASRCIRMLRGSRKTQVKGSGHQAHEKIIPGRIQGVHQNQRMADE